MLALNILLSVVKVSVVVASLSSEPSQNNSRFVNGKENLENICDLQQVNGGPYFDPWQEIPQHAQGCWVPYFGPQGHGHLPEEVHIVHVTNIDRVLEMFPQSNQIIITINLHFYGALCQNITDQTESVLPKNPSKFHNINEEIEAPQAIAPPFPLQRDFPGNSPYRPVSHSSGQASTVSHVMSNPKLLITQRPLVLLLTSDHPVTWKINKGACWRKDVISKVQAIVEKESAVVSDTSVDVLSKTWVKRITRKSIQRYARRTFHGVASFTQVKGANTIKISIGPYGSPDDTVRQVSIRNRNKLNFCDFNSREDSKVVTASITMPLSYEQCVVGESNSTQTFIIEIEQSKLSVLGGKEHKAFGNVYGSGTSVTNLPHAIIYLSDNFIPTKDKHSLDLKNVTIFLKSYQPTQWIVFPSVQHTYFNIVTTFTDVIDCIYNCEKSVKTSKRKFPKSGSELLHDIRTVVDTKVFYFRVQHATSLSLSIEGSTDEGLPSIPFDQDIKFDLPTDLDGKKNHILTILESKMIIVCGNSMLEIFLPAPTLVKLGVKGISLLDKSCQSRANGTHFILRSLLKDCGSDVQTTDGMASVISNRVVVDITSPDMQSENTGSPSLKTPQLEVPIACGWNENYVRSIFNSRGDLTSDEDEDIDDVTPSSSGSSIYQLQLYYKDSLTQKLSPFQTKKFVEIYDRIYVRAWMDDAPSAQAVTESCWINNSPHSSPWQLQQKNVLLSGMCPSEKHVNLEQQSLALLPSTNKSFLFSFQVLKEFSFIGKELYVHCQIGVCLSDLKYSKAKPVLCVDPHDYCARQKSFLPSGSKVTSSAHQVLTRGPILLSASHAFTPIFSSDTKCADVTVFPYSSSISVHMTLTIAICSFIIGIGLTASLWLIHHKTEPKQRGYHSRAHSLGSQSAVLGSSLSPHSACSSTNSQSAITS